MSFFFAFDMRARHQNKQRLIEINFGRSTVASTYERSEY